MFDAIIKHFWIGNFKPGAFGGGTGISNTGKQICLIIKDNILFKKITLLNLFINLTIFCSYKTGLYNKLFSVL